jgi:hypothetical protein
VRFRDRQDLFHWLEIFFRNGLNPSDKLNSKFKIPNSITLISLKS